MSNNINALRTHLFATLQALRDKDNPMDVERAKAISDVAQTVINTAKVELEFMRQTGADRSPFVPDPDELPTAQQVGYTPVPIGVPAPFGASPDAAVTQTKTGTVERDHASGVTRHKMGD